MYNRLIYVAGPYRAATTESIQANIDRAAAAAQRLWRMGWVPICPHLNSAHFDGDPEWYLTGYLEVLRRCDAMYVLKDWVRSEGTKAEIVEAANDCLPIYFEGRSEPPVLEER
ncbi:MAG: DUF4406 domain-containing protein [Parcubacteria group bacterium]